MYVQEGSLDGLLRHVLEALLAEEKLVTAGRGDFKEVFGGCLHLTNPLARLSRTESKGKVYSALGEFLWYLSKDTRLDFIDYYIPGRFQKEPDSRPSGHPFPVRRSVTAKRRHSRQNVMNARKPINHLANCSCALCWNPGWVDTV